MLADLRPKRLLLDAGPGRCEFVRAAAWTKSNCVGDPSIPIIEAWKCSRRPGPLLTYETGLWGRRKPAIVDCSIKNAMVRTSAP